MTGIGSIKKPLISLSLHVDHKMTDWAFGDRFITMLCDLGPQLTPDRVGTMERRTNPFLGVEQCKAIWAGVYTMTPSEGRPFIYHDDFVWTRRKKVKTSGILRHVFVRERFNDEVPGSISVDYSVDFATDWSTVFSRFCALCRPMYAVLHLFDGIELTFGSEEMRRDHFRSGGYSWHLEKRQFPNLAWINLFGGKFRDIADRSALERDGFHTETIGDGWLLRLTTSIADVQADYPSFVEIRKKAKRHFPEKFFLIPD
jgi:hypothetical protein